MGAEYGENHSRHLCSHRYSRTPLYFCLYPRKILNPSKQIEANVHIILRYKVKIMRLEKEEFGTHPSQMILEEPSRKKLNRDRYFTSPAF